MKLWEGLSQDLNFNVMFSQRGVLNLAHTLHDMREIHRRVNANRLNGVDAEIPDAGAGQGILPDPRYRPKAAIRCWARRSSGAAASRATMRWPGALPAPPTSAASTSSRTARSPAFASNRAACSASRRPRASSAPRRSAALPPAIPACSPSMAGMRLPHRKPSAAGAGLRADQAGARHRRHVERGARLRQPVRQGRAGDRRRHRQLQLLCASAAAFPSSKTC